MKLNVEYTAQIAEVTGVSQQQVTLDAGETLAPFLRRLASIHGEAFSKLVFDDQGDIRSTLLLALDDVLAAGDKENLSLSDVSVLLLMMPVAGG